MKSDVTDIVLRIPCGRWIDGKDGERLLVTPDGIVVGSRIPVSFTFWRNARNPDKHVESLREFPMP